MVRQNKTYTQTRKENYQTINKRPQFLGSVGGVATPSDFHIKTGMDEEPSSTQKPEHQNDSLATSIRSHHDRGGSNTTTIRQGMSNKAQVFT